MARLAAFDMDGTFLMPNYHLGDEMLSTLLCLREHDITLTLATDRHVLEMRHISGSIPLDAFLTTGNGMRIHSVEGDVLHRQDLNPNVAGITLYQKWDTTASIHVPNDSGWFTRQEIPSLLQAHAYSGFCYQIVGVKCIPAHQATKVCSCGDHGPLIQLRIQLNEALGGRANLCLPAFGCLEVLPPGCNKGSALAVLSDHLGYLMVECMVFGDIMSDREMLDSAGCGLTVGNAVPQLIAELPHLSVIGHYRNQAVSYFLTYWLDNPYLPYSPE